MKAIVVSYHWIRHIGRPECMSKCLDGIPQIKQKILVASNYDHITKRVINKNDEIIRLPVIKYRKNISLLRVFSYFGFVKNVLKIVDEQKPQIVLVCVPDYLTAIALLAKKKHNKFLLIIDVVDLWPEAFPLPRHVPGIIKNYINIISKKIRTVIFKNADLIFYQSTYFLKRFRARNRRDFLLTMCIPREKSQNVAGKCGNIRKTINIIFLGSINHITDIISLGKILETMSKTRKVKCYIIGGGEGLKKLKFLLLNTNVKLTSLGVSFQKDIKRVLLNKCHFGFNGYKRETDVAVSYKALEYLANGVPLLNQTQNDLTNIVKKTGCGFNYQSNNLKLLTRRLLKLSNSDHARMKKKAYVAYNNFFSFRKYEQTFQKGIKNLLRSQNVTSEPQK
jgi:glycosyltransferase involved in cell wall biosynthesis